MAAVEKALTLRETKVLLCLEKNKTAASQIQSVPRDRSITIRWLLVTNSLINKLEESGIRSSVR